MLEFRIGDIVTAITEDGAPLPGVYRIAGGRKVDGQKMVQLKAGRWGQAGREIPIDRIRHAASAVDLLGRIARG